MNGVDFDRRAAELQADWASNARWQGIKRDYTAEDVVRLRGSVEIDHTIARLGAARLWTLLEDQPFVRTFGALTGAQAVDRKSVV